MNTQLSDQPLTVWADQSYAGDYHAHVMQGRRTVASCNHFHRTYLAAIKCGEEMKRKAEQA